MDSDEKMEHMKRRVLIKRQETIALNTVKKKTLKDMQEKVGSSSLMR